MTRTLLLPGALLILWGGCSPTLSGDDFTWMARRGLFDTGRLRTDNEQCRGRYGPNTRGYSDCMRSRGWATVRTDHVPSYQAACESGVGGACYNLGIKYSFGRGVEKDPVQSTRYFRLACDRDYAAGCFNLAISLRDGVGVPRDLAAAGQALARACTAGLQKACIARPRPRPNPTTVVRSRDPVVNCRNGNLDMPSRIAECGRACERGADVGCFNLGVFHDNGQGMPQNDATARLWYSRGCFLGSGAACFNLGLMYKQGEGGPSSQFKAFEYFNRGCFHRHGASCYNTGFRYLKGLGTIQHRDNALKFFDLSCRYGYREGCDARNKIR